MGPIRTVGWVAAGVLGLGMSLFYAEKAREIFVVTEDERWQRRAFRFHQWWLNFLGSAAGRVMLGLLVQRTVHGARPPLVHAAPVAIGAFLGVTGHLPMLLVSVPEKAWEALSAWLKPKS